MARGSVQATGEYQGYRSRPKEFVVVTNMTGVTHIIPPDDEDSRHGKDLVIKPWDSIIARDLRWADDENLMRYKSEGKLAVEVTDVRPKRIPRRPSAAEISDPRLANMVYEIVFGEGDRARDFINSEPRYEDRPGTPLNLEWLRTSGVTVLKGALAWLKAWGPPDQMKWKVLEIEERLKWIQTEAQYS